MSLRIPGIVLAAGSSSRMGSPKALLSAGRETFVARVVRSLWTAGMGEIVIVTGIHHHVIDAEVARWPAMWPVRVVRNEAPGADQLSSLRCGLDEVDHAEVEAVLVALVDHPFVAAATVRTLLHAFADTRAPIVRPARQGRHGHPVVFGREAFATIRAVPSTVGAKAVLSAFAGRVRDVEVEDEGAWTDIDTPDAYVRALARFATIEP